MTPPEAGTDSDAGSGSCSAPSDSAPTIAATCNASAAQSSAGGSIADGIYFATADVVLADPPCSSTYVPSTTLQIANGVFAFSYAAAGLGGENQQWSYALSGLQVTLTLLCDTDPLGTVGAVVTPGYTATETQLTLFFPSCCADSYTGENVTFARQ